MCVRQKIIRYVGGQLIKNDIHSKYTMPATILSLFVACKTHKHTETRFYIWASGTVEHWLMTVHRFDSGWAGLGGLQVEGKNELYSSICYNKRLTRNDDILQMMCLCVCVCAVFFVGFPRMSAMEFMRAHTIFYPLGWPHVLSYYYICNDKVSLQAMLWHKLSTHFSLENKPRAA